MNIIFGKEQAELLREKYTVLELDTVIVDSKEPIITYCVVDNIPLENLPTLEDYKQLHNDLMENYRKRNWNYCVKAIKKLESFWPDDINTFYSSLLSRIEGYLESEPDENWTGALIK